MTPDEELAVKAVEARLRGMHPEWVRWFVFYQCGRYLTTFENLSDDAVRQRYGTPPDELEKDTMRNHTQGRYEP